MKLSGCYMAVQEEVAYSCPTPESNGQNSNCRRGTEKLLWVEGKEGQVRRWGLDCWWEGKAFYSISSRRKVEGSLPDVGTIFLTGANQSHIELGELFRRKTGMACKDDSQFFRGRPCNFQNTLEWIDHNFGYLEYDMVTYRNYGIYK